MHIKVLSYTWIMNIAYQTKYLIDLTIMVMGILLCIVVVYDYKGGNFDEIMRNVHVVSIHHVLEEWLTAS